MSHFGANGVLDVLRFSFREGGHVEGFPVCLSCSSPTLFLDPRGSFFDSVLTMTPSLLFFSPILYVRKLIQTSTVEAQVHRVAKR